MSYLTTLARDFPGAYPTGGRLFTAGPSGQFYDSALEGALCAAPIVESGGSMQEEVAVRFRDHLNCLPEGVMIVNRERQVLFVNQALVNMLQYRSAGEMIRKMPCALMRCIYACEDGNCGQNDSCRACVFNKALLSGMRDRPRQSECKVSLAGGKVYELLVKVTPMTFEGEDCVVCTITDIADYKRRETVERVFFHDLLNTAAGLRNLTELMRDAPDVEAAELREMACDLAGRLCDDLQAQQMLNAAETNNLYVGSDLVDSLELLDELRMTYSRYERERDVLLVISPDSERMEFVSDAVILKRILSIFIRNAVEASGKGERVVLSCTPTSYGSKFTVHNPGYIPLEEQKQIFNRFFSTKGRGRGLGTYSAKLYTERYLQGEISFQSNPFFGTQFTVRIPHRNN